jgi:ribosomal protein S18 acetylase RimI-like enzyme
MTRRGKLQKLSDPLYMSAVAYWAFGRVSRLQVHKVLVVDLSPDAGRGVALPTGFAFCALHDLHGLTELGAGVEEQIDQQSGLRCRSLLARGDRVYALVESGRVACQLNIRRGPVAVDSPTDLMFDFAVGDLFLNYLHTRDQYRGRGLASALIRLACADAARGGARRCLCHVRATNHSSIAAFCRCSWAQAARILTTRTGRFIAAPGCSSLGMTVRAVNGVESSA